MPFWARFTWVWVGGLGVVTILGPNLSNGDYVRLVLLLGLMAYAVVARTK